MSTNKTSSSERDRLQSTSNQCSKFKLFSQLYNSVYIYKNDSFFFFSLMCSFDAAALMCAHCVVILDHYIYDWVFLWSYLTSFCISKGHTQQSTIILGASKIQRLKMVLRGDGVKNVKFIYMKFLEGNDFLTV